MSDITILEQTDEYIKYSKFLIFTDGSALSNAANADAGWAAYIPSIHKLFSKEMVGTNNQAELEAIRFALTYVNNNFEELKHLIIDNEIIIRSDSKYSIDVLTGAKNGKLNLDRIGYVQNIMKELEDKGVTTTFIHIGAHTNKNDYYSRCNDLVDKASRAKASRE